VLDTALRLGIRLILRFLRRAVAGCLQPVPHLTAPTADRSSKTSTSQTHFPLGRGVHRCGTSCGRELAGQLDPTAGQLDPQGRGQAKSSGPDSDRPASTIV
jgi:hypothetical protein